MTFEAWSWINPYLGKPPIGYIFLGRRKEALQKSFSSFCLSKTKNKNLYQRPIDQEPMTLELPQGRNALVGITIMAKKEEAFRGEGPNNHLIAIHALFAACIVPWFYAKLIAK